jgi:hypothetical protein
LEVFGKSGASAPRFRACLIFAPRRAKSTYKQLKMFSFGHPFRDSGWERRTPVQDRDPLSPSAAGIAQSVALNAMAGQIDPRHRPVFRLNSVLKT